MVVLHIIHLGNIVDQCYIYFEEHFLQNDFKFGDFEIFPS